MSYNVPLNVLIIDDDDISNFILQKLIRRVNEKTELQVCKDGGRAIEYLMDLIKKEYKYPDFIFVDIAMPVMNGWAFLDQFVHYGLNDILKSKIFMATSSIFKSDYDLALSYVVVTDLIIKPFRLDVLTDILSCRSALV